MKVSQQQMSKSKQQRTDKIARLKDMFEGATGGVLADFRGMTVGEMAELRQRLREKGASLKVVKNTLATLALEKTAYVELGRHFKGPTSVMYCNDEDPIAATRTMVEFAKDNDNLKLKAGFMEGHVLELGQVLEVAKLSGKQELRAQFLSVLNAPAQRLLGVFNAVSQQLVGVLKARAEKLEAG